MKKGMIYHSTLLAYTGADTADWQLVYTPREHDALVVMHVINQGTQPVRISFDGIDAHDICLPGSSYVVQLPSGIHDAGGLSVAGIYMNGPGPAYLSCYFLCKGS